MMTNQVGGRLVIDLSMGPSKCKTNESYTPLIGATKRKRKSHRDNVHINNMKQNPNDR
ncbi:hypothetical protein DPMN_185890 [Dreissena polymorpha]|uniref:Uncharacterized protein n=1 Tax=Dreissena polymorpha TaxID=45954 RepID=A0A9D4DKL7_DREPO|nr:hypothetical protein DPMN_185890 [Dreissena polymorpha]